MLAVPALTGASLVRSNRAQAISCATAVGEGRNFYPGPKSSNVYDTRFHRGPALSPNVLDTHVPQGLATWENYYGRGADLLVYTAYDQDDSTGRNAFIQGVNPRTGRRTAIAEVAGSHVGGIAVAGKWVFVSGRPASDGHHTVRKYRARAIRRALQGRTNYVRQVGAARHVYGASFLADHGGVLFAGRFDATGRDRMYRYRIDADTGALTTLTGAIEVPMKTQGLTVTRSRYVFSTSYGRTNRSNIYVTRKGHADLDAARPRCFRGPSMSEGVAVSQTGRVYLVFESGSAKYRDSARNPISRLHWVTRSQLL
jgi:hypothetical protein